MVMSSTRSPALRHKLRRDLGRQRTSFMAVALTIMLGVALFGAAYDAYANLLGSYNQVFDELNVADIWVVGGDTDSIAEAIDDMDGVSGVATRVEVDVAFRVDGHKLGGRVVGLPDDPVVNDIYLLEGDHPSAGQVSVLAEDHLASEFNLGAGDSVEMLVGGVWQQVEVSGSASSGEYLWLARDRQDVLAFPDEFGVVFTTNEVATELLGVEPNQVLITVDGRDVDAVVEDARAVAEGLGAVDVYTLEEQPSNAALSEDIKGFAQMAFLFPILFLTTAAMAAYTLLSRRIHAERTVIGMLRAQGVTRSAVLRHYLAYGLVAGLGGAIPGALLGLWLAGAVTRLYVGFLSLPITTVSFHPLTPLLGVAFGLGAGALAALAPARAAAATAPAEAMRGIVPASGGRRTLLERLVPFSSRMSASSRLVLRSISRNRKRSAMTTAGVVLSLLLILVSWSLLDTIRHNLDAQFSERDRSDAQVVFDGFVSEADLDVLGAVDGVEVVEPLTLFPVAVRGETDSYATTLVAYPADSTLRTLDVAEGAAPAAGEPAIALGAALGDLLDIEVGDTVEVTSADDTGTALATVEMPVAGFVSDMIGSFAYATRSGLAAADGLEVAPINAAALGYRDGVEEDTMREQIQAIPDVVEYQSSDRMREAFDSMTALLVGFITVMLVVGGVLAATMIFTTASVSIAERANEVATLRASGVSLGRIARLITAENLLVTTAGVVPGVLFGVLGGRMMWSTYTTDQFAFEFAVSPTTIVFSAAAVFAVAVLSQIPGLRALRVLDLAETVRERSA